MIFDTLRKKLIVVVMIGLLIGFMLGFGYGVQKGIETATLWGLKLAKNFMTIEFDEEEIASMLWAYKNRVDRCYDGKELQNNNSGTLLPDSS